MAGGASHWALGAGVGSCDAGIGVGVRVGVHRRVHGAIVVVSPRKNNKDEMERNKKKSAKREKKKSLTHGGVLRGKERRAGKDQTAADWPGNIKMAFMGGGNRQVQTARRQNERKK